MRGHVFGTKAETLAENDRADQTRDTSINVNDRTASEVEHAFIAKETAAPNPVANRRVNDHHPQTQEPQHRREFHAIGKSAGDESRGNDGKCHLERHEYGLGDRAGKRAGFHAGKEGPPEPAIKGVQRTAVAKGNGVTDDHPKHRHQTGDGKALHGRRQNILAADHAAVEKG